MALTHVKGLHTTPGIYQKETEIRPAATRTSNTTLGVVGETLRGPAFEPIAIENWRDYEVMFGGTSTEIYKGSKYPRYELPYIAKDFLSESNQLIVTRVLGLSGYHAGKAWLIKAIGKGDGENMLVGVLRSRGHYVKTFGSPSFSDEPVKSGDIEKYVQYIIGRVDQTKNNPIPNNDHITYDGKNYKFGDKFFGTNEPNYSVTGSNLIVYGYCGTNYEYDKLLWDAEEVYIGPSGQASTKFTCGKSGVWQNAQFSAIPATAADFGTFKLIVKLRETGNYVEYSISLNPGAKNYIYNVLGGRSDEGSTPIWVEELYDVAFQSLVYKNGNDPKNFIEGILLNSKNGSIDNIVVTAGGSGYNNPVVTILDSTGYAATAFATVSPGGEINQINLTSQGNGYVNPTVIFSDPHGVGASATVTVGSNHGRLTGITIATGGTNYCNPVVTITDVTGTGATAVAVQTGGVVTGIAITNPGSGYTAPVVAITDSIQPATVGVINLTPIIGGNITAITGFNTTTVYTTFPTVTIAAPTGGVAGSGVTATAIPTTGYAVTGITVTNPGTTYTGTETVTITDGVTTDTTATITVGGSGNITAITGFSTTAVYTTIPTVSISGGDGTATATADTGLVVTAVNVVQQGTKYITAPTITITDGMAIDTTAAATFTPATGGAVGSVNIIDGGCGYTAPTYTINGDGTGAVVTGVLIGTSIPPTLTVTTPGTLYTNATLTITDPGSGIGTGATATATNEDDNLGKIIAINLLTPGVGYTAPIINIVDEHIDTITVTTGGSGYIKPSVVILDATGSGATAEAVLDGPFTGVASAVTIINPGSGYQNPVVVIADTAGGYGTGARAHAVKDGTGAITAIIIDNAGTNYTTPVITISDNSGVGTGATATATVAAGIITSVRITNNGGYGYSVSPSVSFSDLNGTGATATATIAGQGATAIATAKPTGVITGVSVSNKGAGYTGPTVTITDQPVITKINVLTPGSGYVDPVVIISDPTGVGATALATIDGTGAIIDITVGNAGTNYTNPSIVISDQYGTGATAFAQVSGGTGATAYANVDLASIRVIDGGANYPTLTITDSTGYGATAELVIDANGILPDAVVIYGGTGYTAPTITVNDFVGTGATAAYTLDGAGSITSITITGGTTANGYPKAVVNDSTGYGRLIHATVDASGQITSLVVDEAGNNYSNPVIAFGANTSAKAEFLYNGLTEEGEFENIISKYYPVDGILEAPAQSLLKSDLRERYLYSYNESIQTDYIEEIVTITTAPKYNKVTTQIGKTLGPDDDGKIFVVKEDVDPSGKKVYNYHYIITSTSNGVTTSVEEERLYNKGFVDGITPKYVYVNNQKLFYEIETFVPTTQYPYNHIVQRVIGDLSDYKEQYKYASTPWIVSEMIGEYANNEVKRLFRFHTISDGDTANTLYKISIVNIDVENLTFDVIVRSYLDTDAGFSPLENFRKCNLNPKSPNYILNKIGDFKNSYAQKSRYVMVEVADDETIRYRIPCGFLGIPVRDLGVGFNKPQITYNTTYYAEIKERKQYFGYSDTLGIDTDSLAYKGRTTYTDGLYTDGFHLDSRVNNCTTKVDGENPGVNCTNTDPDLYINGVYTWQTPSIDEVGQGGVSPQITSSGDVLGTIYENGQMRKFTVCFYGGFDAWDPYRQSRSTSDDFNYQRYKGRINSTTGEGAHFDIIRDDSWGFGQTVISSDFYAFWAGYLKMADPHTITMNIFATPGIDYVNDTLLSQEAIDTIEDDVTTQRALYIITTPDKPYGADDMVSSMYTAEDAIYNLNGTDIDSSYTATYYPWARYFDENENKNIFLPITKDAIKLMAHLDAVSYPWSAPAGTNALVECMGARSSIKVAEQDTLTGGRINPAITFSRDGVFIWGQKNLKISYDDDKEALTRISVRRMMIRIKYLVERANRSLIFTPNDATTESKFRSNTEAILLDIKSNRGISDFRIETDMSIEAQEARTLPVKVWIKPINLLEFIEIEWVITPQGMSFPE
jgi:hypothetical protein